MIIIPSKLNSTRILHKLRVKITTLVRRHFKTMILCVNMDYGIIIFDDLSLARDREPSLLGNTYGQYFRR